VPSCEEVLYHSDLEKNLGVCPKCSHHHRVSARTRLDWLLDGEGRFEIGAEVLPVDTLKFKDSRKYSERLIASKKSTDEDDALVVMQAASVPYRSSSPHSNSPSWAARWVRWWASASCAGAGSPGSKMPVYLLRRSGGARMQEGLLSLMQMAKTCAALTQLSEDKLPFISVLTDPTMGGVSASFAFMATL